MFCTFNCWRGIRSIEDINKLLNCGAMISINTAAVENSKVVVDSSKSLDLNVLLLQLMQKN